MSAGVVEPTVDAISFMPLVVLISKLTARCVLSHSASCPTHLQATCPTHLQALPGASCPSHCQCIWAFEALPVHMAEWLPGHTAESLSVYTPAAIPSESLPVLYVSRSESNPVPLSRFPYHTPSPIISLSESLPVRVCRFPPSHCQSPYLALPNVPALFPPSPPSLRVMCTRVSLRARA